MSTVYKNPTGTYHQNYKTGISAARVNNAQNIYTDEFKSFLQRIQAEHVTTTRLIPLDEPRIQVDLNTRVIDIANSEYADFLSMAEDHRAETVYFEVDRYFEDVDLFGCTCIVEYINGGDHPRIYPVTLKDIDSLKEFNKMILAWNIGNEATLYQGEIQFSLTFYRTHNEYDEQGNIIGCYIAYALHTIPATGTILYGMDYSKDQEIEKKDYYQISADHYEALLAMINQKNIYWNDV